ncbi:hypothetical protein ACH42_11660 [Endozoicomonas sp. (ex Bugula neritina AB1)]|nr:hypothetical protein ACH42_11660 [Endozoicomonas sp. (ex Bugula neritina AB1)]
MTFDHRHYTDQPLAAGYQPLVEEDAERGSNVQQSDWRGRKVSKAVRLQDATEGLHAETGKELKIRLRERYGGDIQKRLVGKVSDDKEINQRKVIKLEAKALSLFNSVQKGNKKNLASWIKGSDQAGLVAEQFERVTGFSWESVNEYERRFMVDQVRAVLAKQPEKLTKASASALANIYLQNHQSYFSRACTNTADVLKDITGWREPLLVEHLSELCSDVSDNPDWELTEADLQCVGNFQFLMNRAMSLVTSSDLEDSEYVTIDEKMAVVEEEEERLAESIDAIEDFKQYGLKLPEGLREAMLSDLQKLQQEMRDYGRQLAINYLDDPRNAEEWGLIKKVEVMAAYDVLDCEVRELNQKSTKSLSKAERECWESCKNMRDQLSVLKEDILAGRDGNELPPDLRVRRNVIQQSLPTNAIQYREALGKWLSGSGIPKSRIQRRIETARNSVMKEESWKPIEKHLSVRIGDRFYECTSQIIPATNLTVDLLQEPAGEQKADIFPSQYMGKGCPSAVRDEAIHAVNLCETRMDSKNGEQFRALRSGALSAFGIKDSKKRAEASKNRAREVILSALRIELERNPDALTQGKPVPLRVLSTSLLTPDEGRHYSHIHDDEYAMYLEQVKAVKEVEQEIRDKGTLDMMDQSGHLVTVPVELDVITMNFGVNPLALNFFKKRLVLPWEVATKESRRSLEVFMGNLEPGAPVDGWAGEFIENEDSDHDKQIVIQLVNQIRQLYVTENYKSEGEDAYKMAERLQVLAYKLGVIGHFNCKSGKDRTGEADASIKRLMAQIDVLGYVPDPNLPLSREEQVLRQSFYFLTGNIELQRKNLNLPGYKTQTGKGQYGEAVYQMAHLPDYKGVNGRDLESHFYDDELGSVISDDEDLSSISSGRDSDYSNDLDSVISDDEDLSSISSGRVSDYSNDLDSVISDDEGLSSILSGRVSDYSNDLDSVISDDEGLSSILSGRVSDYSNDSDSVISDGSDFYDKYDEDGLSSTSSDPDGDDEP